MTPQQFQALAAQGRFWWYRMADETFHATAEHTPPETGDTYLLDASPQWLSQWNGDWQAAAAYLTSLTAGEPLPMVAAKRMGKKL